MGGGGIQDFKCGGGGEGAALSADQLMPHLLQEGSTTQNLQIKINVLMGGGVLFANENPL